MKAIAKRFKTIFLYYNYNYKYVKLAKQYSVLLRDTYIHNKHKNTDGKDINQLQDTG